MIAGEAPNLNPECVTCYACRERCPVSEKARRKKTSSSSSLCTEALNCGEENGFCKNAQRIQR